MLHPLLAFLLLLEQLALARDVAAVALGGHVLAQRLDGLAGDDLAADRGLERDLELVRGRSASELAQNRPAAPSRLVAVTDDAERLDRLRR